MQRISLHALRFFASAALACASACAFDERPFDARFGRFRAVAAGSSPLAETGGLRSSAASGGSGGLAGVRTAGAESARGPGRDLALALDLARDLVSDRRFANVRSE